MRPGTDSLIFPGHVPNPWLPPASQPRLDYVGWDRAEGDPQGKTCVPP